MEAKTKLPYVVQPGMINTVLPKIRDARTPDRFTVDFLKTKLNLKGGNFRQFIPLAKKIGLLNSDATPTDLYKSFRNPSTSKAAMAAAIKKGYVELFERNEYAGNLNDTELKGVVVEITGLEPKSRVVALICQTFKVLKAEADFEKDLPKTNEARKDKAPTSGKVDVQTEVASEENPFDIRLGYTINLVLPKTDDQAVFNAIFKALRENLLRK